MEIKERHCDEKCFIWSGSQVDIVYFIESIGPETETMIWPTVKDDAKPSSSSSSFSVTTLNAQRSCKASATSTTRHPATSNRFDCLIHSPIIC